MQRKDVVIPLVYVATVSLLLFSCSGQGGWLSPVKVTDNIYSDEVASLSYDGTRIVYASDADGDYDIYLIEYAGCTWSVPQKLTTNYTPDTMPVINSDGTKIAYIGGPQDNRQVFFMESVENVWQQPVQVTFGPDEHFFPSLTAEGEKIACQAKDQAGNRYLWFIERIDGSWQQPIQLPTVTDNNMFPVISARGATIAFFAVDTTGYRNIYCLEYMNHSWQESLTLTENNAHDCQPAINADGTKIVYYSTGSLFLPHVMPGALSDVLLLEKKDGIWQPPVTIAGGFYYEFDPTIDGSGKRITYAESVPGVGEHVYITEFSEGVWQTPVNLTSGITSGFRPNISGDGNTIVYYGIGGIEAVTDVDYEIYLLKYARAISTITGKVTDGAIPLEAVLIHTDPGNYMARTAADGSFVLQVTPGTYSLTARKNCFTAASISEVQVSRGGNKEMHIALESGGNCGPFPPDKPYPVSGDKQQATDIMLRWDCSDPDAEDSITFDVYVGLLTLHHIELHIVSGNQKDNFFHLSGLEPSTTYHWKVVARDSHGYETTGPLWNFTTGGREF